MPLTHTHTSSQPTKGLRRRICTSLTLIGFSLTLCWQDVVVTAQFDSHAQRDEVAAIVPQEPMQWRRTNVGWEPTVAWEGRSPQLGPPPSAAKVHPVIVATLQALLSIGALIVFEYTEEDESTDLVHMLAE